MEQLIAYTENGKWGYRDKESNEILIPAQYDEVIPSAEEIKFYEIFVRRRVPIVFDAVQVKLNGKWGLRSVANEEILPALYEEIKSERYYSDNGFVEYYVAKINDKCGILNKNGEIAIPFFYDEIEIRRNNAICVRQNDKWGTLNENGQQILPIVFDKIHDETLTPNLIITFCKQTGLVTLAGNIIIPPDYDDVYTYTYSRHNTFWVKKNGKWQLVDRKNKPKNSQFYDAIEGGFESEIIAVLKDDKWGFIYKNGQEASSLRVDEFSCGEFPFLKIRINDKWGVLKNFWKLEEILPVEYDEIEFENLGLCEHGTKGEVSVMDEAGNIILPPIYNFVYWNSAIKLVGKKADADDFVYIPPQYIEVEKNGKYGFFDIFGNEKVPVMYDGLDFPPDYSDTIPAFLNGKWGYINMDNEEVVPFIYDKADAFGHYNFAKVTIKDKHGLIDRKGNIICPLECERIEILDNDLVRVEQNGKTVHIDQTGKIIEQYDKNALVNIAIWLKEKKII